MWPRLPLAEPLLYFRRLGENEFSETSKLIYYQSILQTIRISQILGRTRLAREAGLSRSAEPRKPVVRCPHSATLFKLASWTAITGPVPVAHFVALLLVLNESGSI